MILSLGTTSINDLVSQIKVPVSLTSCQKLLSAAANASVSTASGSNNIGSGLISTGLMDASQVGGSNSRYDSHEILKNNEVFENIWFEFNKHLLIFVFT